MNKDQIHQRIQDLINVHSWTNHNNKILSATQRICLTQERAALMELLEIYHVGISSKYTIPYHLETKLQEVLSIIKATKWEKPKYKTEPY